MSRKVTFSTPEKLLKISLTVLGIGFILMVIALLTYFNNCSCMPAKAADKEKTVGQKTAKETKPTATKKFTGTYDEEVNHALKVLDGAELNRFKEADTKASSWKTPAKLFSLYVYMNNLSNQQPYLSYDYYYDQALTDTISVNFYSSGKVEVEEETTSYNKIELDLAFLSLSLRKAVELSLDTHLAKYPDFKVEALFISIYGGDDYWSVEIDGPKDPITEERPEYRYKVFLNGTVKE